MNQTSVKSQKYVPIFEDPLTEEEYLGIAKILNNQGVEFEFGGKTFYRCEVSFMNDKGEVPVVRLIDGRYLTVER